MALSRRAAAIVLTGVVGGLAPQHAFAQRGRAAPIDTPRVDLGLTVAARGAPAELNVTLRLPEGVAVGKAEVELRYPKSELEFVAPRPRPTGVQVKVDPQAGQDGDGVLKVTAERTDAPIPAGVLTTLVFRVRKTARENASVRLPLEGRLWAHPDTSQEITPVDTPDGRVTIQDAATFFACFFYMH